MDKPYWSCGLESPSIRTLLPKMLVHPRAGRRSESGDITYRTISTPYLLLHVAPFILG